MHRRLVAANVAKQPGPAIEVIDLLRGLLEAWRKVAAPRRHRGPDRPTARRPRRARRVAVPVAGFAGIRA